MDNTKTSRHLNKPPPYKKILIVRLSAIGDIVMALPVARALKNTYPEAEIHWLSQPECLSLVKDEAAVSQCIAWPRKDWAKLYQDKKLGALYSAISVFKKQLRSEHYDLAIDLQGLLKSGVLTWLSGAKHKIGLGSREGSQYLMNRVIARNLGDQDLIGSEYRSMIETLSGQTQYTMALPVAEDKQRSALAKVANLTLNKPFIVLCPFTTRPQKHWVDNHWQKLMQLLLATEQYELVMLGGPADTDHAQRLIGTLPIHSLVGQTDLQEAGAVITASAGLIGVDTGLTHMGHAANIPTVAIFGSTRPYLNAEKATSHIIYQARSCSPCKRKPTCNGAFDCMHDISPELVLTQLQQAIAANTS